MKKFLFGIIVIIIVLTIVPVAVVRAQTPTELFFNATPNTVTLSKSSTITGIIFDILTLPVDANILSAELSFVQETDITSTSALLYLKKSSDDTFLSATGDIKTKGLKKLALSADQIESTIANGKIIIRLYAEGLAESDNLAMNSIILRINYSLNDTLPPEIQSIATEKLTTSSITIKWNTNERAKSYLKYGKTSNYSDQIDSTIKAGDDVYALEHSVVLDNLLPGTTYHFQIVAMDEAKNEVKSPNKTFLTPLSSSSSVLGSNTRNLPTPTSLVATLFYDNEKYFVRLSWNTDQPVFDGYYIYRREGTGDLKKVGTSIESNFEDKDVVEGKKYEYIVRGYAGNDISSDSNDTKITISKEFVTKIASANQPVDLPRLGAVVAGLTFAIMIVGYFIVKRMRKIVGKVKPPKKRKNLFYDAEFFKDTYDKAHMSE